MGDTEWVFALVSLYGRDLCYALHTYERLIHSQ